VYGPPHKSKQSHYRILVHPAIFLALYNKPQQSYDLEQDKQCPSQSERYEGHCFEKKGPEGLPIPPDDGQKNDTVCKILCE
jgi:hypothetical protein